MSETEIEIQHAHEAAPVKHARVPAASERKRESEPDSDVGPSLEPATSDQSDGTSEADASVPTALEVAQQAVPATDALPGNMGRTTQAKAITVPWESDLPGVSSTEIRAELARRQRRVPKLLAERERVIQRLDAIEQVLESIGEAAPPDEAMSPARTPTVYRARNSVNLKNAIAAVVEVGATVSPRDVAEAVQKSGYRSNAAHFGQMIAATLSRLEEFERVGRGRYLRTR